MSNDRASTAAELRRALARYRGGRFETGESGGAGGMMFFIDVKGQRWYIGGMANDHAAAVTGVLNQLLKVLFKA